MSDLEKLLLLFDPNQLNLWFTQPSQWVKPIHIHIWL